MKVKSTTRAMIFGSLTSIVLIVLKVLAIGIIIKLSWWLIVMPVLIIILGFIVYVAIYIGKIFYRGKKYMKQREDSNGKP